MIRMGRPRTRHKDMPLGMRLVGGRWWHWRPTDEASRLVLQRLAPGKTGIPAGRENTDKAAARKWWAQTILPALDKEDLPPELRHQGLVREITGRYRREVLEQLAEKTQDERRRHLDNLDKAFGDKRYAKNEAEASTGEFLRAMHLTAYLDEQLRAKRPVQGNKEVQALSRCFHIAKARWGLTEYNPCLQVEYNEESPRLQYQSDANFMAVYAKAPPILQVMMDMAQMHGPRRGMLLKLNLVDIDEAAGGLWVTMNKKRRNAPARRQLIKFLDAQGNDTGLREVVDRALELRRAVRGGQRQVLDLELAPLFLNRKGKRITVTGFNSMWQRAARAAGFKAHEYHFHDNKVKSLSDSPSVADAQDRGGHLDGRTTREVYRAKPIEVIPLPRVSKKGPP
jgi:integrase